MNKFILCLVKHMWITFTQYYNTYLKRKAENNELKERLSRTNI